MNIGVATDYLHLKDQNMYATAKVEMIAPKATRVRLAAPYSTISD